jgi:hypothetical protein
MENNSQNNNWQQPSNFQTFNNGQEQVPNANATLVLGILSIITCWLYGVPGIILGIIALYISGPGKIAFKNNPSLYSVASYNNLKAGRICAIIGLSISALFLLIFFIIIVFIGTAAGVFSAIN